MNLKAGHEGSAMQVGCVKLPVVKTGFGERRIGGQDEQRRAHFPLSPWGILQVRVWVWTPAGVVTQGP